jgi:hypothetical protein
VGGVDGCGFHFDEMKTEQLPKKHGVATWNVGIYQH